MGGGTIFEYILEILSKRPRKPDWVVGTDLGGGGWLAQPRFKNDQFLKIFIEDTEFLLLFFKTLKLSQRENHNTFWKRKRAVNNTMELILRM